MVEKALKIVMEAFAGKVDKAGSPYIFHLERVASSVGDDETLRVVAYLHDLIEDCPEWTEKRLMELFPERVCVAVMAMTKIAGESYPDYLQRVAQNEYARKVKLADLKDNMNLTRLRTILSEDDLARIKKYHSAYLFLSAC